MKILQIFAWLYPSYAQMNVAAIGAAAAVGGSMISANASSKASKAQGQAAALSDETQRYMFDETNRLQAPFRDAGVTGINRLQYLMGLGGFGGASGAPKTYDQLREEMKGGFSRTGSGLSELAQRDKEMSEAWLERARLSPDSLGAWNPEWDRYYAGGERGAWMGSAFSAPDGAISYDESALDAAVKNRLAQQAENQQNAASDPNYGSLLRNFSQADLDADPIYRNTFKFALDEGTKGLNRSFAAGGNMLSGAAAKALTRFGANTAATYGNDSFNRNNIEKTNTYNRLAGISGIGQQATNQVAAAGQSMANNISANQIGLGNARGASAIAQGNALAGGIGNAFNSYQQSQLMNNGWNSGVNSRDSEMNRLMAGN